MYFIFGYNSISDLTAEKIAMEALSLLYEEQIIAGYVATDFENEFAEWGDIVRATYPVEMTADRVPEGEAAPVNSVSAGSHNVKLNQRITQAFTITDREQQRSFQNLSDFFLRPAVRSMAVLRDRIIQGECYRSFGYTAGSLGSALAFDDVIDAGTLLTENYVPATGRNMICGPRMGAGIRKMDEFVANVSNVDQSIIRTGFIGDINGFAIHETASFTTVANSTRLLGAVNLTAGYAAGATTLVLDSFTGTVPAGAWVTIDGVPYRTTSKTDSSGNLIGVTIENGLREAVANDAVVYAYSPATVNFAAGYDADYEGGIVYDGSVTPKIGQGVTFGTTGKPYSIVKISGQTIWLNRPLDAAVADDASIFLMPGGNYGIALTRNSIQLVNRPLAVPSAGQGVQAATVNGGGWSMRVMSEYNMLKAETTYLMDFIMGVATLNPQYNVLFLG